MSTPGTEYPTMTSVFVGALGTMGIHTAGQMLDQPAASQMVVLGVLGVVSAATLVARPVVAVLGAVGGLSMAATSVALGAPRGAEEALILGVLNGMTTVGLAMAWEAAVDKAAPKLPRLGALLRSRRQETAATEPSVSESAGVESDSSRRPTLG